MNDEIAIAALCKALGHPIRVRILKLLLDQGSCQTGSLVDRLPLAQSTISEHLRILKAAGLVIGETNGANRCYCASTEQLASLRRMLETLEE